MEAFIWCLIGLLALLGAGLVFAVWYYEKEAIKLRDEYSKRENQIIKQHFKLRDKLLDLEKKNGHN